MANSKTTMALSGAASEASLKSFAASAGEAALALSKVFKIFLSGGKHAGSSLSCASDTKFIKRVRAGRMSTIDRIVE